MKRKNASKLSQWPENSYQTYEMWETGRTPEAAKLPQTSGMQMLRQSQTVTAAKVHSDPLTGALRARM